MCGRCVMLRRCDAEAQKVQGVGLVESIDAC